MIRTPSGMRLHIGIFGRRNVGKSSLLNKLIGKNASVVSDTPGTTTDPVRRSISLDQLGLVTVIDTAGLDDVNELGEKRREAAEKILQVVDLAILVAEPGQWTQFEASLVAEITGRRIPGIIAVNKIDLARDTALWEDFPGDGGFPRVPVSSLTGEGFLELKKAVIEAVPDEWINSRPMVKDLLEPGKLVIQVMPIDSEAPVGRILLPQAQAVSEVLEAGAISIVIKETELQETLDSLTVDPDLVITDSSAFALVSRICPRHIPLTSYSVLMARCRGDLPSFIKGSEAIDFLKDGDIILVAEACVHHPIDNDIGRVQIPTKLMNYTGKQLKFEFVQGRDFPKDLSRYALIIHCGACVFTRRQMLRRIEETECREIPITNYGIVLAKVTGILDRSVEPLKLAAAEMESCLSSDLLCNNSPDQEFKNSSNGIEVIPNAH